MKGRGEGWEEGREGEGKGGKQGGKREGGSRKTRRGSNFKGLKGKVTQMYTDSLSGALRRVGRVLFISVEHNYGSHS